MPSRRDQTPPSAELVPTLIECATLVWRKAGPWDIKPSHFERICPHGVGHPDPDALAYAERRGLHGLGVHGCDGCCK